MHPIRMAHDKFTFVLLLPLEGSYAWQLILAHINIPTKEQ